MGVKQHCLNLERDGYLGTFRRHRGVGRPELSIISRSRRRTYFHRPTTCSPSPCSSKRASSMAQAPRKDPLSSLSGEGEGLCRKCKATRQPNAPRTWPDFGIGKAIWRTSKPNRCRASSSGTIPCKRFSRSSRKPLRWKRDLFQRLLGVKIRPEQRQAGGTYEYVFFLALPGRLK